MFKKLVRSIVRDPTQKYLDSLKPIVTEVADLEAEMQALSDAELRQRSLELRAQVEQGAELEEILPEAFALVRVRCVGAICGSAPGGIGQCALMEALTFLAS